MNLKVGGCGIVVGGKEEDAIHAAFSIGLKFCSCSSCCGVWLELRKIQCFDILSITCCLVQRKVIKLASVRIVNMLMSKT